MFVFFRRIISVVLIVRKIIEEEIKYIANMNTSDEKMVRIMNLEKEIKKLSNEEKNNVKNMELFYNEVQKLL